MQGHFLEESGGPGHGASCPVGSGGISLSLQNDHVSYTAVIDPEMERGASLAFAKAISECSSS